MEILETLQMESPTTVLEKKIKLSKITTIIFKTCRITLRNKSRNRLLSSTDQPSSKRQRTRSDIENFIFETQCFYCGYICDKYFYKFYNIRINF